MTRRDFIRFLSNGVFAAALVPRNPDTNPKEKRPIQFVFAQLKYRGGDWNRPAASCRSAARSRWQQQGATRTIGFRCAAPGAG